MKTLAFVGQKNVYMLAKTLHATTVKERLNKAYKATKLFSRCLKNKVVGFYKNKGYPKIKLVLPCKNRVFARKRLTKLVQSLYLQKQSFCTRSFVSFVSFVWREVLHGVLHGVFGSKSFVGVLFQQLIK